MKQTSLADTKEFKELMKRIKEANKDAVFMAGIKRFIKLATNHR